MSSDHQKEEASSQSSEATHSNLLQDGYFHKSGKGASGSKFKRRFFRLFKNRIEYSSSPKDKKIKGECRISDVLRVEDASHGPQNFKSYGLSIITPKRTYKVCFEDAVTRQTFKEIMSRLIDQHDEDEDHDEEEESEDDNTLTNDSSEIGNENIGEQDDIDLDDNFDEEFEENPLYGKYTESMPSEMLINPNLDRIKNSVPDLNEKIGSYQSDDHVFSSDELISPRQDYFSSTPPSQTMDDSKREDWSDYSENSEEITRIHLLKKQQLEETFEEEDVLISKGSHIEIESKILFPEKDEIELIEEEESMRHLSKTDEYKPLLLAEDNLNIGSNKNFCERIAENHESEIYWSGVVKKIVKVLKNVKIDDRSLVVTNGGIYLLNTKSKGFDFKTRLGFEDISCILINAYESEENDTISIQLNNPVINNGHDMLLAFQEKAKEKFLNHLKYAYERMTHKQLVIHAVDDVTLYSRSKKADKKPTPVPISKEDIITSSDHDFAKLVSSSEWRAIFRKYGDKFISFSEEVTSSTKRIFYIVTNMAVIKAQDTKIQRRVDLQDITEIWIDNATKDCFLLKVPSEYDFLISNSQKRVDALQSIQEELNKLHVEYKVIQTVNVQEKGQLKKTQEYRLKMKRQKDPKRVKEILHQAMRSKDLNQLEKAVISARVANLTNDKLYSLCEQQVKKIKEAKIVKEEMEEAFKSQNLKKMRDLLKQAELLRPHLSQLIHTMTPKYTELVNTKLFKKKMEQAINNKDYKSMKEIFSKALQVGLYEEVEKYKREYDANIQKDNLRELLALSTANRDGDTIRLILLHAKTLGIDHEKIFHEAKSTISLCKAETKMKRKLLMAMDDANENGNVENLKALIIEAKTLLTSTSSALHNTIDISVKEMEKIKQRVKIKQSIEEAIIRKDKTALEEIIEHNKHDDRLDLTRAYNCLDLIQVDREQEQMAAIHKLEETLDSFIVRFEHEPTAENQRKLLQVTYEAERFDELSELVASARNLIHKTNMEAKRRERKILSLKHRLSQGIKERDIESLEIVVEEGPSFPELSDEVQIAKKMLTELYLHLHAKENLMASPLSKNASETQSTKDLEAFLKSAQQSLGTVEKTVELKLDFEELLERGDIVALAKFLYKNQNVLSKEEIEKASLVMEELSRPPEQKDEIVKSRPISSNYLISTLHSNIMNLLRSCDSDVLDPTTGRYIVNLFPFGEVIVKNITSILYQDTRRVYWIKERTPYDVFKNLQSSAVQEMLREFEALDSVQQLPQENFGKSASLLLIQFFLDADFLVYALNQLLHDEMYLTECYEKSSPLIQGQYRDELVGVFSLLNQFDFRFGLRKKRLEKPVSAFSTHSSSTLDTMTLHPILQLKEAVKSIVQFFFIKKNVEQLDLQEIGNESRQVELDGLIRKKLFYALMDVFLKGFKSFSIFKTYHIWNVIEEAARLKQSSAVDIGGIGIPLAVDKVNKIVEERLVHKQLSNVEDLKFRAFLCYSLNDHQLSYFIQSIFREQDLIANYYEPDSMVRNQGIKEKVVALLSKLDSLPFQLSLTAELL
ncbi:hypothetical protein C9374_014536 [Naegleria lovaniensis]|uniref:RUN domain-containing protein n=1 Tax=Naegleria lovaniensis TaxID=51637 RepID=A0AA88GZZ9_NAELO|nr:uncharacterized protein C9374_014536 [Naegleria lovaniensis]KAG2389136.1 hypothetical protein C9374_014536 [Naegleria lovaniensis]